MLLKATLLSLAQQCAPNVAPHTLDTLVLSESSGNPYAIGVVGMELLEQPKTKEEAIATAEGLLKEGALISAGLGQIYVKNWERLGLTVETVFEPCPNLKATSEILTGCYERATGEMGEGQKALQAAFSCYYSNNFSRGFVKEAGDRPSYLMNIAQNSEKLRGVPEIEFKPSDIKEVQPEQKKQPHHKRRNKRLKNSRKLKPNQNRSPTIRCHGMYWATFTNLDLQRKQHETATPSQTAEQRSSLHSRVPGHVHLPVRPGRWRPG